MGSAVVPSGHLDRSPMRPRAARGQGRRSWAGALLVEVTNKACERALRPAVVQRKVTDNDRAMWAAEGEAAIRPVVDTTHLTSEASVFGIVLRAVTA
jgi:transposase